MDRRSFLAALPALAAGRPWLAPPRHPPRVLTVRGPVDPAELGTTLVHEHVLVDFVGADKVSRQRYDAEEAFRTVLPHLMALKQRGGRTLVECTPAWLGRDPAAALCHRRTALRIHCHTGDGRAAMDILSTLDEQGVSPAAFVWVHAQNEKDRALHLRAARAGAWTQGVSTFSTK